MSKNPLPWTTLTPPFIPSDSYVLIIVLVILFVFLMSVIYLWWKKKDSWKIILIRTISDLMLASFIIVNILDLSYPISLMISPKCWCEPSLLSSIYSYIGLSILIFLKYFITSRILNTRIWMEFIIETAIIVIISFSVLLQFY